MVKSLADLYNRGLFGDYLYNNSGFFRGLYTLADDISGFSAVKAKEAEYQNSIDYYQYLKRGYDRQLADWTKNVGIPQKRTIRYPELSYPGLSYGASKNISNNYLGIDATYANYTASAPYRAGGLYSIYSRASRFM